MSKRFMIIAACTLLCGGCGEDSGLAPTDDAGFPTDANDSGGGETSSEIGGESGDAVVDSEPPADPTDRSKCISDPDKLGLTKRTVASVDGSTTYAYAAYAPSTYDPKKPSSLLIGFHGAGDTADNYLSMIWQTIAEARGFLVLIPEGSSKLGAGFTYSSNDARYVENDVLLDFVRCYSTDQQRKVIHGFAAGGLLAYTIGFLNAKKYAGVLIAGSDFGQAEILATSAGKSLLPAPWLIPVSHTHGLSDPKYPIAGARAGRDKLLGAGHTVNWHEFEGGSAITADQALVMWDELAASKSP